MLVDCRCWATAVTQEGEIEAGQQCEIRAEDKGKGDGKMLAHRLPVATIAG